MIRPNQVKTILAGLRSCNYAKKPTEEQLAFIIGYLAGSAAAAGQSKPNSARLTNWSVRRMKESEVLLKLIKKEREIVDKQAVVAQGN